MPAILRRAAQAGLLLLSAAYAPAMAETTQCTVIATLPATISTPGVYCLESDFAYSSVSVSAITIAANNVTLDLNGHRIGNLAAGTTVGNYGVYAINQQNITVKNGTLRGFATGILLADSASPPAISQGHVVQGIRADQNRLIGIQVVGNGCIVRNNQVVATGGSTLAANESSIGISVSGTDDRILDNDVSGTTASGSGNAYGVEGSAAEGLMVIRNRISETTSPAGPEYGVQILNSPHAAIRNNVVSNSLVPSSPSLSVGIMMDSATDVFAANTASGFGSANSGGTPVTAPACAYLLNPTETSVPAGAGTGLTVVEAAFGCPWTAVSNAAWISVTGGASSTGTGSLQYSYAANPGTSARSGTITAAALTYTVNQAGTGAVNPIVYAGTGMISGSGTQPLPGCVPNPMATTTSRGPFSLEWHATSDLAQIGPSSITDIFGASTETVTSTTEVCGPLTIPGTTTVTAIPSSSRVCSTTSDGTNISVDPTACAAPSPCSYTQMTTTITRDPKTLKSTINGTWAWSCVVGTSTSQATYQFTLDQQ